ncbi:MAG: type II secretion system protein GspM [Sphingomonadaceae bacterium]
MSKAQHILNRYREAAASFWLARTGQERQFLSVGAVVLGLALFYALLVAPALDGRVKLRKELPQLHQQAAELQALALEAAALKSVSVAAPPPMTRDTLTASLAARSLSAQSISVTGEYVRLQLNGVPFAGLMDWLDVQRREGRISVQDASITAKEPAGTVDALLTLRQGGAR